MDHFSSKSSRLINHEGDYCESSYTVVILSINFCPFGCTYVIFTSKCTLYSRDATTLLCADVIILKVFKMTMEACEGSNCESLKPHYYITSK